MKISSISSCDIHYTSIQRSLVKYRQNTVFVSVMFESTYVFKSVKLSSIQYTVSLLLRNQSPLLSKKAGRLKSRVCSRLYCLWHHHGFKMTKSTTSILISEYYLQTRGPAFAMVNKLLIHAISLSLQ